MNSEFSKIIFITGTSSGFGLLTSARLAAKGYQVVATMRDVSKQADLLQEVSKRGGQVDIFSLDVTQISSVEQCIKMVIEKYGRVDVLINNAGFGIGGSFEDLTQDEIRQNMEVNFFGVQNVTRAVLPQMRKQKSGRIINISSVAGLSASPFFSAYNSSKWALEAFSECLSYEVKPFGIDVCMIEPGTYPTKIFYDNARYAKGFDDPQSPYHVVSKTLKRSVLNYVNASKKDPENVAKLVEKLIESKNPALRNLPDNESRMLWMLRRFLPFAVYRWMIMSSLNAKFGDRPRV